MQRGAPRKLLAAAAQAAQDEVRHALLATEIATELDGRTLGPGALACADVAPRTDWVAIAVACIHEGCVGETIAAAQLDHAARLATPTIAERMRSIAADEARHSELAWAFIAWSWRNGGQDVRAAIESTFDQLAGVDVAPDPREPLLAQVPDDVRRLGGRQARGAAESVARNTLRHVILPCAAALRASA